MASSDEAARSESAATSGNSEPELLASARESPTTAVETSTFFETKTATNS